MPSLLARVFSAVLALSLTACVSFSNSVVDKPIANDERLIGYWEVTDEKPVGSLMITADGPTSVIVTLYPEESVCGKDTHYSAARTQIGGNDFLDVTAAEADRPSFRLSPISYEFRGPDRLVVFSPDNETLTQAVATKELSGKISKWPSNDQISSVEIEASTAVLRQWVTDHPAAMRAKSLELVRRDPASAPHCG